MQFGTIPVGEATGATLAHSVQLGDTTLRKGRKLSAEDVVRLLEAGIGSVVAARFETADVLEDEAAGKLAKALAAPLVDIRPPFTGRANLQAGAAGLLIVDKARIDRLNAVHEAVTLATLPAFAAVQPGQMLATVKIIPFAAPSDALEHCLEIAREAPLLQLMPFQALDAVLIQTELPSIAAKVLDKTARITADRLEAVGGRLASEARCAHTAEALALAVRRAKGDLLLIAGASAITDRRDVLPAGIEAAGGTIRHFGMPVDPGNLMLLAEQGGRTVLGLPGCARSPKLNGFDWVLQRLAARIEVTPTDIMGMGVGGLLAEIPTRPQPRARKRGAVAGRRIAGVILAAGQSRRMGVRNKLLIPIDGKPMVVHAADAVLGARLEPVLLVTGHEREKVEAVLAGRKLTHVHNPDYALGLSTSLKAGLSALPNDIDGALVCLGDMPRVDAPLIERLVAAFNPVEGRAIVVPTFNGKRGNPVLWSAELLDEMRELEGDVGARHLIGAHGDLVFEVEMADGAALLDIDTPEALDALADRGADANAHESAMKAGA